MPSIEVLMIYPVAGFVEIKALGFGPVGRSETALAGIVDEPRPVPG